MPQFYLMAYIKKDLRDENLSKFQMKYWSIPIYAPQCHVFDWKGLKRVANLAHKHKWLTFMCIAKLANPIVHHNLWYAQYGGGTHTIYTCWKAWIACINLHMTWLHGLHSQANIQLTNKLPPKALNCMTWLCNLGSEATIRKLPPHIYGSNARLPSTVTWLCRR